jgi:hypothetical protein
MRHSVIAFIACLLIAFSAVGQSKIEAFRHLGRSKTEIQKENKKMVYNFRNGYLRPLTYNQVCSKVEIQFTEDLPANDKNFIKLFDTSEGVLTAEDDDGLLYTYTENKKRYRITVTPFKDGRIDKILISTL